MKIKPSHTLVEEAEKTIKTFTANEVAKFIQNDEVKLIDVRDIRELWKEGTIKGSTHIPRGMLEFWLDPESSYYKEKKIDMNKKLVLFCALGLRSALATKTLVDMGFENVAHVCCDWEEFVFEVAEWGVDHIAQVDFDDLTENDIKILDEFIASFGCSPSNPHPCSKYADPIFA